MFCQGGKEGRKEGGKEGWRDGIKALFAFCSGTKYRMVQLVAHWYFEHGMDRRKEGSSSEHSVTRTGFIQCSACTQEKLEYN